MSESMTFDTPITPDIIGVTDLNPEMIKQLTARLKDASSLHNVWADPILFNGGTILVLLLTTLATLLPTSAYGWAAPLCSALAGLFVAMERALGFGARWRYHREMRFSYESIIDMLDFFPAIPLSERPKYIRDIFAALYAARSRESAIPNAGTNSAPT
ncbi:hypothetical protein GKKCFE_11490 [Pseudomonas sp. E141]|uniref:hypothetical protein n=1 Tax=Pseudomonas sp. E141 TaxID=2875961 RepID=UPI00404613E0